MRHPLISLWRHGRQVHFLTQDAALDGEGPAGCAWRPFAHSGDALAYLRFWLGDGAALADLRHLDRLSAAAGAAGLRAGAAGPDAMLAALAARLSEGALRVAESERAGARRPALGRLCLAPSGAGPSLGALAGLPDLADLPAVVELPPLLPALEQVQIEGAEVMPEVLQSLEQIDAALGSLGAVGASLDPLPHRVPDVPEAMAQASAELRRELDAL
jgi:hypothetical protein